MFASVSRFWNMSVDEHDGVSIDSRDIENARLDVNDKAEILMSAANFDDDDGKYGELILLGYNGSQDSKASVPLKRHRTKMALMRRKAGNGIKKGSVSQVNVAAKDAPAVLDKNRHVVSYSYSKNQTVLVEYVADPFKDMFQIGRSSEEQIDFTIVDTWLASGSQLASSSGSSGPVRARTGSDPHKMISSTISRYACRIIIDRENYDKAFLYAAGFDSVKNIFLGEKATKWMKKNGEMDGLTTNGILILHPNRNTEELSDEDVPPMYVWREVSVDGDIYTLRETRSSNARGVLVTEETNMLQDGSLIDLCGATLLWRTADGLRKSPTAQELEMALDRLNAGKPQCPVNLNTLIIPKRKSTKGGGSRQPYVYLRCGHVQGKHEWGHHATSNGQQSYKCPICLAESERVIQLTMGMESAFHLDSGSLDHAFNPCGHVASLNTVRFWSRIPLPHGTNSFHPVCPFCTTLLATEKPYVRLIFQDHLFDN
ncbi:E3 ubiquitin-protein ligase pellino [Trichostrongylus colubriformis]|uniref:E3 ubiquitin-protein ligase pellino n=1 Tax=Trichostrongylus colubriformis TaxID=6319 RepID=A0AAN8FUS6_TRICO